MPLLKNQRHEQFAHAVANGEKPHIAYVNAGFSEGGAYQSSNKLLKKPEVEARIAEISANKHRLLTEKVSYTVVDAMREAEEAFLIAKGKENGGAMVAAATLRAKLMGLLVDKKEIRTGALDELSAEERDAAINAIRRELEGRASGVGADRIPEQAKPLSSLH
jgi:hypothetical protein